ncbi:DinB family protein [Planctomycetota bacterium]|nr:DinB family protein [Planctomycetota bacterium]
MNIKELLKSEAADAYQATQKLFDVAAASPLDWKPETGSNWMTVGQCIHHCIDSCGAMAKGFVTGNWDMLESAGEDDGLPSADKMPSADSIEDASKKLAADQALFNESIDAANDEDLLSKTSVAPWGGEPRTLAGHINTCILHLVSHRAQLFYYLKL